MDSALSKEFQYFVPLDRITAIERRAAAMWCIERLDPKDFSVWHPKGDVPGFWFRKEQDALMFTLKYA